MFFSVHVIVSCSYVLENTRCHLLPSYIALLGKRIKTGTVVWYEYFVLLKIAPFITKSCGHSMVRTLLGWLLVTQWHPGIEYRNLGFVNSRRDNTRYRALQWHFMRHVEAIYQHRFHRQTIYCCTYLARNNMIKSKYVQIAWGRLCNKAQIM